MKLIIILGFIFIAAVVGQRDWYTGPPTHWWLSTTTTPYPPITKSTTTTTPHPPITQKPCGSNTIGDYKGSCDESMPAIVLPNGRPIMQRVLDWFKCGTKSCRPDLASP